MKIYAKKIKLPVAFLEQLRYNGIVYMGLFHLYGESPQIEHRIIGGKRNDMKKALAMILSLIMLLSMIPAAFAAEGAELLTTAPAHGDTVVIYYPAGGQVISTNVNTYNGNDRFDGVSVTVADNKIAEIPSDALVLDTTIDANGYYTFTMDGKYLTSGESGNALFLADTASDFSLWTLESAAEEGSWYIKNVNAAYSGKGQYIEYFHAFTMYGFSEEKKDIYTFQFFKTGEKAVCAVPAATPAGGGVAAGTTVTLTCATEGATIYYSFDNATWTKYTEPVAINESCTLYSYAEANGVESGVASYDYVVGIMNIKEALQAGKVVGATVVGQLAYRFGNFGSINSSIIQAKIDGEIYALQVYNALDYDGNNNPIEIGDWVALTGTLGAYGGVQQISSCTEVRKAEESEKLGEDAKDAQVFEDFEEILANHANYLSEYVMIKNVQLGTYSSDGSTAVTDSKGNVMNIYRAAAYPTDIDPATDLVNLYCAVSQYNTTKQLRNGSSKDYRPVSDAKGPTVTRVNLANAEVGADYKFEVTVTDASDVSSVAMQVLEDGNVIYEAEMQADGDNYSAVIPGDKIGTKALTVVISAKDGWDPANSTEEEFELTVIDLPQIIAYMPGANAATGADKRPVIAVTFANVGEDYTVEMLLNGEAVTATIDGATASYTPASDLADGKYQVEVTVTRNDGKQASIAWSFNVGDVQYQLYFGQLHSHTAQYSDGTGTLAQAYDYAKNQAKNVDFLAVTDHSNYFDNSSNLGDMMDPTKGLKTADGTKTLWQEALETAKSYNDDTFVALYGYEMTWSGQYGHINTFNTQGIESRNNSKYVVKNGPGLVAYYDKVVEVADWQKAQGYSTLINQFNHPGTTFGTFEDFAHYSPAYDEYITMVEVGNGEGKVGGSMYWPSYNYYDDALAKGWHLAPTNNQDNHKGAWGDSNTCRDVIYTDDFSVEGLYQAMRDMRMYATEDNDLEIIYTLNGENMGTIMSLEDDAKLTITVDFNDPTDRVQTISIIGNGGKTVEKKTVNAKSGTWTVELDNDYSYYYIRIDQADSDIAVTAPVWTKETVKIGLGAISKDTTIELKGEPITFTIPVYNYEEVSGDAAASEADFTVTKVVYSIDGKAVKTIQKPKFVNGGSNVLSIDTNDDVFEWKWTPSKTGRFTMSVDLYGKYRGTDHVFSGNLSFTVRDGADMKTMLIDAGHANFYVSGNYADSDTGLIELGAQYGVKSAHITEPITDEILADCDLLVLTVPFRGASISVLDVLYTDDELAAIKKYADNGGNLIVSSKSDRLEPSTEEEWASNISNEILEAIGATARIGKGIVSDIENMTNESYRLHFTGKEYYNWDNPLNAYLIENTNLMFSCYNAAPVILNDAEPIVKAFDTSFVSSYPEYYNGGKNITSTDMKSKWYYDACGDQEDVVVMAYEELPGGGFCITSGVTFFSTFEVKVEVESASTLQNSNYQMVVNLFKMLNPAEITPIADIHKANKENVAYTIEGYVTANASGYDKNTAFFDCIYLQDDSGRGINVFPVSGNYQVGQKLRISGMTSSYMGEIELNSGNDYGGEITDITLDDYEYTDEDGVKYTGYAARAALLDVAITMANKQTVETYTIDDSKLNEVLHEVAQENMPKIETKGETTGQNLGEQDLMEIVTTESSMSKNNVGNLVEIYGKIVKVEYDANGVVGVLHVNDGSGVAKVFLDGYIDCDCGFATRNADGCTKGADGYHDLSACTVGAMARVRGIASIGQNSYEKASSIGPRIRIRNRADIEVWQNEVPKTGESVSLVWVGVIMLIALVGLCGVVVARKRYNH